MRFLLQVIYLSTKNDKNFASTGVIPDQNCIQLLDAALNFFFKNLFYQKLCKYVLKIGVTQTRGALLQFFAGKKNLSYLCRMLPLIFKMTPEALHSSQWSTVVLNNATNVATCSSIENYSWTAEMKWVKRATYVFIMHNLNFVLITRGGSTT